MENATERAESGSERKGTPGPFPEARFWPFFRCLPVFGGATQKMGRGNRIAAGIYLLARVTAAFFSLGLASNLALLALVLLADRVFAGELVLSTKLARNLHQRFRDRA